MVTGEKWTINLENKKVKAKWLMGKPTLPPTISPTPSPKHVGKTKYTRHGNKNSGKELK